jgi:hypothetical protein
MASGAKAHGFGRFYGGVKNPALPDFLYVLPEDKEINGAI